MLRPLDVHILRQAGRRPRVHPNGFIQLDLTDDGYTRLHVWPEAPLVAQRSHFAHPVHDHKFDMTSRVICGCLDCLEYAFVNHAFGDHILYEAINSSHVDSVLRPVRPSKRGNLVAMEVATHTPQHRPQYRLNAFRFHQALNRGLTATIMNSENPRPNHKPLVAVPLGVHVDNHYNRHSYHADQLWRFIEDAIEHSTFDFVPTLLGRAA